MKNFEVIEFRKINLNDFYDDSYNDGSAWSRVYEYPIVLNKIKELAENDTVSIHNSSWGFQELHLKFKNELDHHFSNCVHSDLKKSKEPKTIVWNITKLPPKKFLEKFDFVINISTIEEVNFNHLKVFNNLLAQVKVGGYLIATFDLPGLQLNKIEKLFDTELKTSENDITGINSKLINPTYSHLSCGIMVVKKIKSTLKKDKNPIAYFLDFWT